MLCECIANGKWGWSPEKLIALGMTQTDSESAWGVDWELATKNFTVYVDCTGVVKLARHDTEYITAHIDTMADFEALLDWVRD